MNKNLILSILIFVGIAPIVFGLTQSLFDVWSNHSWATFELSAKLGIIVGYVFGFPLAVFLAWVNTRLSRHWLLKMTVASFAASLLWYTLLSYQQVWDLVLGQTAGWGDLMFWGGAIALASTIANVVCAGGVRLILKWRPR